MALNKNTNTKPSRVGESGNAVVFVLIAVLLVLVGVGIYLNQDKLTSNEGDNQPVMAATKTDTKEPASGDAETEIANTNAETAPAAGADKKKTTVIKEGNPVVAKIGDKEIFRVDVLNYMKQLPPNMQQLPVEQLFPIATVQVVNQALVEERAEEAGLETKPEIQEQLELAKSQIIQSAFLQQQVEKNLTEDRIKEAYTVYVQTFPKVPEVRTRHILVQEEEQAKKLLKELKGGADFAEIAKANSIDTGTSEKGGQLGFVAENEVVPAFSDAIFNNEPGLLDAPVKSNFGYHIIEIQEKRVRPAPSYEEAKPFLLSQLQNMVLEELFQSWRQEDEVEVFDVNGEPYKAPEAEAEAEAETPAE
tara:strand:+ start:244 stop:1329 length:1086 start_codon:yes stop_codon:yes gene_type:complete